jgi:hypothetical protein
MFTRIAMRTAFAVLTLLAGLATTAATQVLLNVEAISFSEPAAIMEIDTDRMKGQPARLSWSPDGSQLYLQMLEGNFGQAGAKLRHFAIDSASGRRQDLQAEPDWASAYWTAKSAQSSPDGPAMKIELKSETRTATSVPAPMGGDLARGGTTINPGATAGDAVAAAYSRQTSLVHSMLFKGEIVGEFVNSVIVPGLTFGWGPLGSKMIVYTNKSGRIVVMAENGGKKEIESTKDALLPAWSPDGRRLAWLQKDGRKKFVLQVARVAGP